MRLWAALKKETLALSRDLHAVAALFVMPVIFILIMSLALQDTLSPQTARKFSYAIDDRDQTELSRAFVDRFHNDSGFTAAAKVDDALAALREQHVHFIVSLRPGFESRLQSMTETTEPLVQITAERGLSGSVLALARAQAELSIARLGMAQAAPGVASRQKPLVESAYLAGTGTVEPTAVQQSVPAWLVFAMFFVVIPLSTIFITERDYGTLRRLRAMGVSVPMFFGGKIVPFFIINQIQAITMLLVGAYVVPLFGGEALSLGSSWAALALLLAATSLAAIGYAMLVAVSANTVAQATIIGGVGNILLGAIGGVMAPKFLMPPKMQQIADVSPMAWALDGLLDVLLRSADVAATIRPAAMLAAFAGGCLMLALIIFYRRSWQA